MAGFDINFIKNEGLKNYAQSLDSTANGGNGNYKLDGKELSIFLKNAEGIMAGNQEGLAEFGRIKTLLAEVLLRGAKFGEDFTQAMQERYQEHVEAREQARQDAAIRAQREAREAEFNAMEQEIAEHRAEVEEALRPYGLAKLKYEIDECEERIIDGKNYLVLTRDNMYRLTLPLDETFRPEAIDIDGGEGNTSFSNINGKIELLNEYGSYGETFNFYDSNVDVIANDNASESIYFNNDSMGTVTTGEYSDVLQRDNMKVGSNDLYVNTNLRPGTTNVERRPRPEEEPPHKPEE